MRLLWNIIKYSVVSFWTIAAFIAIDQLPQNPDAIFDILPAVLLWTIILIKGFAFRTHSSKHIVPKS